MSELSGGYTDDEYDAIFRAMTADLEVGGLTHRSRRARHK